jgi:hypothetical protein
VQVRAVVVAVAAVAVAAQLLAVEPEAAARAAVLSSHIPTAQSLS